jgi:hypothetical protein
MAATFDTASFTADICYRRSFFLLGAVVEPEPSGFASSWVQQATRKTSCKRGRSSRDDDGAGARLHATYSDAQSSAHRSWGDTPDPAAVAVLQF